MQVKHRALGHPLGVVDETTCLGADYLTVLIGFGGQLGRIQVCHNHLVLPAGEEDRRSRVALTSRASAQLVVESFGAVPPGADDVQPARLDNGVVVGLIGAAEADIGTPAGHLRRHRDGLEGSGLGDDAGFFGIVLGVQHHRGNSGPHQTVMQRLGFGDVMGADEHRLTGGVNLGDMRDDGVVLACLGDVHAVGLVFTDVRRVRRDR